MRKKVFGKQLSRTSRGRKGLFRSLGKSFILNEKVETTKAKALAVSAWVEQLVRKASQGDLSSRRQVVAQLGGDKEVTEKIFGQISPAFKGLTGGFTKMVSVPTRSGDNARMVRLEWTKTFSKKEKVKDEKKAKKEPKDSKLYPKEKK